MKQIISFHEVEIEQINGRIVVAEIQQGNKTVWAIVKKAGSKHRVHTIYGISHGINFYSFDNAVEALKLINGK